MRTVWCDVHSLEDGDIVVGHSRQGLVVPWQGPLHVRVVNGRKRWMDDQGRDQGAVIASPYVGCSMQVLRP